MDALICIKDLRLAALDGCQKIISCLQSSKSYKLIAMLGMLCRNGHRDSPAYFTPCQLVHGSGDPRHIYYFHMGRDHAKRGLLQKLDHLSFRAYKHSFDSQS